MVINDLYYFLDFRSLNSHQVTNTIPKIGKDDINTYGKIAKRVEGSNIVIK